MITRVVRDICIFAMPVAIALIHDIHRHYLTTPDGDLVFIYAALRMNSGLEQTYTGHTGYTLFVLLGWWLKAMHFLGIVSASKLEALPPLNTDQFVETYRDLVYAGRYMIALGTGIFALIFHRLILALTECGWVALLAALLFAASRPLGVQAVMIFTELPSAIFLFLAFCAIAVPGHKIHPRLRVFLIGFFATLSMMAKMQSIGYIIGLMVVALAFGPDRDDPTPWPIEEPQDRLLRNLAAVALAYPAAHMVATSIAWNTIGGSTTGWYQGLVAGFSVFMVMAWGAIYRVPLSLRVDAAIMLALGVAVAWYGHLIHHTLGVTERLANFLDHMYHMSSMSRFEGAEDAASIGLVNLDAVWRRVIGVVKEVLFNRFLIKSPITQTLELLTIPTLIGGMWLGARRQYRLAAAVLLLAGYSLGAEIFSGIYSLRPKHLIYHAPWMIVAIAIIGAHALPRLTKAARVAGLGLVSVLIALNFWGSSLPDMIANQGPEMAYGQAKGYTPDIAEGFRRYAR